MVDRSDDEQADERATMPDDRVLTVPNLLSGLRILMVPVFLWLLLVRRADTAAFWVLVGSGLTDWLDGVVARRYGQVSRLGLVLDPIADRLFVVSTLLGLLLRDLVPSWLVVALVARDLWGVAEMVRLRRHGLSSLPVTFLGKAATFALLVAFPLLLLGAGEGLPQRGALVMGWAFAWWGLGLYWLSAIMYYIQAQQVVRRLGEER
ncbi:CDP-alcohol phosphatidyltransferase family protein [Arsenicicoccus dermatophilus]|uniref:CDP-alcohol phosphatidyltransferase family protein n=1 Tax=Arsenicicoccus dermatophilus TaxID=1076331 RepID=UPI0030C6C048